MTDYLVSANQWISKYLHLLSTPLCSRVTSQGTTTSTTTTTAAHDDVEGACNKRRRRHFSLSLQTQTETQTHCSGFVSSLSLSRYLLLFIFLSLHLGLQFVYFLLNYFVLFPSVPNKVFINYLSSSFRLCASVPYDFTSFSLTFYLILFFHSLIVSFSFQCILVIFLSNLKHPTHIFLSLWASVTPKQCDQ